MFSLKPFTTIGSDNTNTPYYSNNITSYYQVLRHIPKKLLLEPTIKNINLYYFFGFLNLLSVNYPLLKLHHHNCIFSLPNEKLIAVYKNKSGLGICKSKLFITNERLIEISNDNKYIPSYYLSDVNLIFTPIIFGIKIIYKTTFKYLIYWFDLNIPLLDFINSKKHYE
jgi:hypothetical protein